MRFSFSKLKLKNKLIIMIYIVFLPFLLGICGFLYYTMQKNLVDSLSKSHLDVLKQINTNMDFLQNDIENISTHICINDEVNKTLNKKNILTQDILSLEDDNSIQFLLDIIATKSYIKFVAIYTSNGSLPYYVTTDTSVLQSDFSKVKITDYYKLADQAQGCPVWSKIEQSNNQIFEINKSSKIMLSRVIKNYVEAKNIGYLLLGFDEKYIKDICNNALENKNESICLIDEHGNMLTQTGDIKENTIKYITSEQVEKKLYNNTDSVGELKYDNNFIFYSKSDIMGSKLFYIVPKINMLSNSKGIRIIPIVIVIGVLLLLLPISFFVANIILNPLAELYDSMKKFKKGDFNQKVNFKSNDEIGEVGRCYNEMVCDIKTLIDTTYILKIKERESELSSLQAQINPHFLYNTLDCIYWQALVANDTSIADSIYSLSNIFRLSLNCGQGMTTVEKEGQLVYHYLMLQKMRFGEKLNFTIKIDASINSYIIPKLIVQPFVENAIIHGIEDNDKLKTGTVIITGNKIEEQLVFEISDNGRGMTEEQISSAFKKNEGDINTNIRPRGYAIHNIYERLYLKFNKNFQLDITSKLLKGTKVIIKLPIDSLDE